MAIKNIEGYEALIDSAWRGYLEVNNKSHADQKAWIKTETIFPPMISLPDGKGTLFITRDGLTALHQFGRLWLKNQPSLSHAITSEAAAEMAVRVFGEILAGAEDSPGDTDVKDEMLRRMPNRFNANAIPIHFYFPCRVFEQQDVASFDVGPVRFLRRLDWIDYVVDVGGEPVSWDKGVRKLWSDEYTRFDKFVDWTRRKFRTKNLRRDSDDILEIVGQAEWVASVLVEGRDRSRSENCAFVATRVAIDALGLRVRERTARNLRGPGDAKAAGVERTFAQRDAGGMSWSVSFDVPNVGGPLGAQAAYLHDIRKLLTAVGNALTAFTELNPNVHAPDLKRRWIEAMYWFGEARRERDDFIALVKTGISMDVLTQGAKAQGITELACALFQISEDEQYSSEGRTLKELVDDLYNKGRSQISHGGRLALMRDLPLSRTLSDVFAADILTVYVACLEHYTGLDDYKSFRAQLPTLVGCIS